MSIHRSYSSKPWLLSSSSSPSSFQSRAFLLQLTYPPWMCILSHATTRQHLVNVTKMQMHVSSVCRWNYFMPSLDTTLIRMPGRELTWHVCTTLAMTDNFTVTQDLLTHFVLMKQRMMSVSVPQHTHLMHQPSSLLSE